MRNEDTDAGVHVDDGGETPVLVDKITDVSLVELPPDSGPSTRSASPPPTPPPFSYRDHFYYSIRSSMCSSSYILFVNLNFETSD